MKKRWSVLVLALTVTFLLSACGVSNKSNKSAEKITVSVTFNAMKELTEVVGGDKVMVTAIIPDGVEPHDFEPKAQDLMRLSEAKVFVYNGFGMEPWTDLAIRSVDNKDLIVIEASKDITPITNTEQEEISEHGQYDPHVWLSLKGAETEATNIKDGLVKADPVNKDYYEKNCSDFITQLESLYTEFDTKFKTVAKKDFVTGHAAFAYLCRDFGLQQNSVEDVFAEGEPTAEKLAELVDYCKVHQVSTIFVEDMVSSAVSQSLAKEVGAKVETIHTIESSEENISYIARMKDNLTRIYDSLL